MHLPDGRIVDAGCEDTAETSKDRRLMEEHFAVIASHYRSLRDTDHEPVRHICDRLPGGRIVGLDVGAGTGRYTELLARHLAGRASLLAADRSFQMIRALPQQAVPAVNAVACCEAERLPIGDGAVDFVTTFNAVHHFDLDRFVHEAARVLTPRGQLFIYTRTPEQNAQSIWGRAFPEFLSREVRLYDEASLRRALAHLGTVTITSFSFSRRATPARLADRVRNHTYSTFALYEPDELERALDAFLQALPRGEVCWQDHNLLVHVRRSD